jgi:hypothetical protein
MENAVCLGRKRTDAVFDFTSTLDRDESHGAGRSVA